MVALVCGALPWAGGGWRPIAGFTPKEVVDITATDDVFPNDAKVFSGV